MSVQNKYDLMIDRTGIFKDDPYYLGQYPIAQQFVGGAFALGGLIIVGIGIKDYLVDQCCPRSLKERTVTPKETINDGVSHIAWGVVTAIPVVGSFANMGLVQERAERKHQIASQKNQAKLRK